MQPARKGGVTIAEAIGGAGPDLGEARVRARVEKAVLELLADASDSA
jgi:hypothetical protein